MRVMVCTCKMDPGSPSILARHCSVCKKLRGSNFFRPKRGSQQTSSCSICREAGSRYRKSGKGKETLRRWTSSEAGVASLSAASAKHRKTDKWKATRERHRNTDTYAETTAAYRSSDRYVEVRKAEYERTHSDAGAHLEHAIGVVLSRMVSGERKESSKVSTYTEFTSRDDLVSHFSSMLPSGESMESHGKFTWHIGHRIAKSMFEKNNIEDVRRCWKKANLFPQPWKENLSMAVRLPSNEELLLLRDCWPMSWNDKLPSMREREMYETRAAGRADLG